jgi:CO dehydrogenase maturation factor
MGRANVKIGLVGKGGSGKTTLAALLSRHLAAAGGNVLAIDADINQHLAVALGASQECAQSWPTLGGHLTAIKEYLRGDNPRITGAAAMVKTTPPGRGSNLLRLNEDNPVWAACLRDVDGVRLAAEEDLGVACYHSKVGAVELLLNHLVDTPGEYVVVDMTAGADSFASGLFTRFDHTFLVCEPTVRSVAVYHQYVEYARNHDIRISAVGNKVEDGADLQFLQSALGDSLLACFGRSGYVRATERGSPQPIDALEPGNRAVLNAMVAVTDDTTRDWERYTRQAVQFHLRNAIAWANAKVGEDLAEQVDPEFRLGSFEMSTVDLQRA